MLLLCSSVGGFELFMVLLLQGRLSAERKGVSHIIQKLGLIFFLSKDWTIGVEEALMSFMIWVESGREN